MSHEWPRRHSGKQINVSNVKVSLGGTWWRRLVETAQLDSWPPCEGVWCAVKAEGLRAEQGLPPTGPATLPQQSPAATSIPLTGVSSGIDSRGRQRRGGLGGGLISSSKGVFLGGQLLWGKRYIVGNKQMEELKAQTHSQAKRQSEGQRVSNWGRNTDRLHLQRGGCHRKAGRRRQHGSSPG